MSLAKNLHIAVIELMPSCHCHILDSICQHFSKEKGSAAFTCQFLFLTLSPFVVLFK